ncbi:hypothetical protein ACOME3_003655 [Neoechinorhynchus agilis]
MSNAVDDELEIEKVESGSNEDHTSSASSAKEEDDYDWSDAREILDNLIAHPSEDRIDSIDCDSKWVTVIGVDTSDTRAVQESLGEFGQIEIVYVRTGQELTYVQFSSEREAEKAAAQTTIDIERPGKEAGIIAHVFLGRVTKEDIEREFHTPSPTKRTYIHHDSPIPNRSNKDDVDLLNHPGITVRKKYKNLME